MIELLQSAYEVYTNTRTGVGEQMNTINKFAQDLHDQSKQTWKKAVDKMMTDNVYYFQKTGSSLFTPTFVEESQKLARATEVNGQTDYSAIGRLVEYDVRKYGNDYVFRSNLKTDPDSGVSRQKTIDDISKYIKEAEDVDYIENLVSVTKTSFIDSYTSYNQPEQVPHYDNLVQKEQLYSKTVGPGNYVDKIVKWVTRNPQTYNITNVINAFRDENEFMKNVQARWNDSSVTKSVLEGDVSGAYTTIAGEDIKGTIDKAAEVGSSIIHEVSTIPIVGDAITYIEIAGLVAGGVVLLWAVNEIKNISKYFNQAIHV